MIAKVVDLLIEELAHVGGVDLYGSGRARDMAHVLYTEGPRAFTHDDWSGLLRRFNSLMRSKQRKGVKTTVYEFFETVEYLRFRSRRRKVEEILAVLSMTRPYADHFQERLSDRDVLKTMDPLLAALSETVRIWYDDKREELAIVHDQQVALDPGTVEHTLGFLRDPLPEFRRFHGPVEVNGLIQVDSKDDPRVQVADLVAGIGRLVGTQALGGSELAIDPRSFVARSSLWADDRSWQALTGMPSVRS